jgi:4a-hydroxytetrahydrobiopterin dehydratase
VTEKVTQPIVKTYKFQDFIGAMGFVQKVALISEKMDHHPNISIKYSEVTLETYTHTTGTVTEKDHQLIAAIEKILE